MTHVGSIKNIPNFIVAVTPKLLQRQMLINNLKHSTEFRYFDITFDGKQWVAWFYKEVELQVTPLKVGSNV
jgi:hypothetical protein